MRVAAPAALLVAIEWWAYDIVNLLAGTPGHSTALDAGLELACTGSDVRLSVHHRLRKLGSSAHLLPLPQACCPTQMWQWL